MHNCTIASSSWAGVQFCSYAMQKCARSGLKGDVCAVMQLAPLLLLFDAQERRRPAVRRAFRASLSYGTGLPSANGPRRRARTRVEDRGALVLLGLRRVGGISAAADGRPGALVELVLPAERAAAADGARVPSGLAGGDRLQLGGSRRMLPGTTRAGTTSLRGDVLAMRPVVPLSGAEPGGAGRKS